MSSSTAYNTKLYVAKDQELIIDTVSHNGLELRIQLIFEQEIFLERQKDMVADFAAQFIEKAGYQEDIEPENIAEYLEYELEQLNIAFGSFVDSLEKEKFFGIKGYIQVIYNNILFTSLIGDVSIIISRDNKTYYTATNDAISHEYIDTFADFIEGEIEKGDRIIVLGTSYENILDPQDMKEINEIRGFDDTDILDFFEKLCITRVEPRDLSFIGLCHYKGIRGSFLSKTSNNTKTGPNTNSLTKIMDSMNISQKTLTSHRYHITIAILGIFIIFLINNVIQSLQGEQRYAPSFISPQGEEIIITIDNLKKDINDFVNFPAEDPQKAVLYQRIIQQLDFLESENRRPDDVQQLRQHVQEKYYEGFNVLVIDDLDTNPAYFSNIYSFDNQQLNLLGDPLQVLFNESIYIAGSQGAILQGISEDIRGNSVSYGEDVSVDGCNFDLSRQGLYCFDNVGNLYRVTAGGVQPLQTQDSFFPGGVKAIDTFTSSNIYLLHEDQSFEDDQKKIITRYTNILGSYTDFGNGTAYSNRFLGSNTGASYEYTSMAIDGTFLVRENEEKKIYQLRREPTAITELSSREVPLLGGDMLQEQRGDNMKIIQHRDNPYVYLFDAENATLTVYNSNPRKTASGREKSYDLLYLFRLQFDVDTDIVDIHVPSSNTNYMYILTTQGIYEGSLDTFIQQYNS